ncbi:MAG TPA: Fur family transcriptional regulator [Patescibacteria group bacterium]|jgi:Fe2+ or Zn2+ uptake regulation protein|nr:Fur family transcriptional regulator [Patescibacteria group bacterium]
MEKTGIIEQLRKQGAKITKARALLVKIFQKNHLPMSEQEIRTKLAKLGLSVNKTTVYRELAFLKQKKVIKEVDFGDGKKRYEIDSTDHHHHLVCTNCQTIEDVHVEKDVADLEKIMLRAKKFHVTHHSLEFFGLCHDCGK